MNHRLLIFLSLLIPALIVLAAFLPRDDNQQAKKAEDNPKWVLLIHGGAGSITPESLTPEKEKRYHESLAMALMVGKVILEDGGTALDAVESVIRFLEDDSLFNAGRGAVLNASGTAELDASIMDGATLKAGAVAGVTVLKNPISAARAVMDQSKHVMMAGKGADDFGRSLGLQIVDPSYFITTRKLNEYNSKVAKPSGHGTVGAVALDMNGNLAAATSTGGMSMKKYGRVGDSPIIGAGTYADNASCAVSCTGHGEYFIRHAVAYDIGARMKYTHATLQAAADSVVMGVLQRDGGSGGIIAVDKEGNYAFSFNTSGMFRGVIVAGQEPKTMVFKP